MVWRIRTGSSSSPGRKGLSGIGLCLAEFGEQVWPESVPVFFVVGVAVVVHDDYRGGHVVDNSIENYRCYFGVCRGLTDRTASLKEQALAQAAFTCCSDVVVFAEPGWFIKMRELSVTLTAPDRWARAFSAGRMSLTLAARNLFTITDYTGVDPEVNAFGQDNFAASDFESQPQVRYYTARLNLSF